MKITKEKVTDFFSGKGFYLVLAACLIAVGIAAWSAYEGITTPEDPIAELSSEESLPEAEPAPEVSSEMPAGTDTKEPYSSVSEISSEAPEPTVSPIATEFSPPVSGDVLKGFSADELVFSATYKDMRLHTATDIKAEVGSSIKSCGNGVVTSIINDASLGYYVEIDHGNGIVALYCGLDENIAVTEGQTVTANTAIGSLATLPSECLDEAHLHLAFYKNGEPVDPMSLIK